MVKILIMTNNHDFSVSLDSCINRISATFLLAKKENVFNQRLSDKSTKQDKKQRQKKKFY